jgi:hypothetical protein
MRGLKSGLPSASIAARFSVRTTKGRTRSLDAALVRERVAIEQLHQPMELVGLALVRGCRQQQQVGRCLGECRAQLVAGDLVGAATHAVGFVDDDQIPGCRNQILEALPVVGAELFRLQPRRPSSGFTESSEQIT